MLQTTVLIQISRPNSATNKDGMVCILCDYNEFNGTMSKLREDLRCGESWDYVNDKRLPENYADIRIDFSWQREERQDDVTFMYNGNHYEHAGQEFYQ